GGSFVLDVPPLPPAVWGAGQQVAWAQGEALMLCGPAGVGKTTLAVQLVAARLGIGQEEVLGLPVRPGAKRVLYLAMDRPPQIARAMRRLFTEDDRRALDEKLIVWQGPPPYDMAKRPDILAALCDKAKADTVIVDSLKDSAVKLSDDETGGGYNRARQKALVEGVEVLELHHQRKAGGDNKRPTKLDDVYGSTWLTAGAGSVLLLWGEPGDPVVELYHLKQPAEQIGPWTVTHDHDQGRSRVDPQPDVLTLVRNQRQVGMTPTLLAKMLYHSDKPSRSDIERARRLLNQLERQGLVTSIPGSRGGPETHYYAAEMA
ncbi:MAG: AAA family ATPase, partial [Dactylosporangium sp.]|nr:AAA family ATPase [Dactylosporangium sp.]